MNVLKPSDVAPMKVANVHLSDDSLVAQNVCDALNHKLDVYVSSVIGIDDKEHIANVISDDISFSGGIGFRGNDLCIIEGNYIQTAYKNKKGNILSGIQNFSGANSFLQAEEAKSGSDGSYGIACTGAKGWPILSIDFANSRIKLSGDMTPLSERTDDQKKLAFSMTVESVAATSCTYVVGDPVQESLTAGWVQLNVIPDAFKQKNLSAILTSESMYIDCYLSDDNAFYCPLDPTIGAVNIDNFYANHAEGGSTKAIGKYSHAEGRQAIADIRYAHAEGSHCFAGGMASHCEGFGNALDLNVALGFASHCEGNENKAIGDASHAEGYRTRATGKRSHAAGTNAHAAHDYSYVWNGIPDVPYKTVISSRASGTFTVNPQGGINGFYIGNTSLGQLVQGGSNVIKMYSATSCDVVQSSGMKSYTSIKAAVNDAGSANVLQLQNDVTLDFAVADNRQTYISKGKTFTIDLNGHALSVMNRTNNGIASNGDFSYFFMNINNDMNMTVKNGKIYAEKSCMFKLQSGSLTLQNTDVVTDNLFLMMTASGNTRLEFTLDESSSIVSKSNGAVRCPSISQCYVIHVQRTNSISKGSYTTFDEYREAHPEHFPHIVLKGKVTSEGPACVPGSTFSTIVHSKPGNDQMGMIVDVEDGAELNCPNGVAIYSGNNNLITLNGGTITGFTGIGLRGGKLVVPENSDAIVLGTGNISMPLQHASVQNASCCTNGNALLVLCQPGFGSNRPFSDTLNTQEAAVHGGKFISLKAEPVASIAMWKSATYADDNVYQRIEKFVSGGYLSQFPDSQKYDEKTGDHSSYNIVADDCYEQTPCQIMRAVK